MSQSSENIEVGEEQQTSGSDVETASDPIGLSKSSVLSLLEKNFSSLGDGFVDDIKRRKKFYCSDWIDGINHRFLSATAFLYFACLLPSIAFGTLNDSDTDGFFFVRKTIIGQALGSIVFSVLSTQPLVILLSTAPLATFIKLTYEISVNEDINFGGFYAWVGTFNSIFLIIFSMSKLPNYFLQYSSRFVCESFAFFISISLVFDAAKPLVNEFKINYDGDKKDRPLLWLILMFATVQIGLYFLHFRATKLFNPSICEMIGDFSLPIAIISASFIGSYIFEDVSLTSHSTNRVFDYSFPDMMIGAKGIGIAVPLGFALSILMFIDQSISVALVSIPENKLKKGSYYHSDLALLAIINFILSILGLPWIHGALPHTSMHAKALSVTEKTVQRNTIQAVESRPAVLLAHVLIGVSYFLFPLPLTYIPEPVLYGLFVYLGVTALPGNTFYERIIVLGRHTSRCFIDNEKAQEQLEENIELNEEIQTDDVYNVPIRSYHIQALVPVPLFIMYRFTIFQMFCVAVLCISGLYPQPYLNALFPLVLALLIPFRVIIMEYYFGNYIEDLDCRQ